MLRMHHGASLIYTIAAALGMALILGFIAARLRLPALVGYLLAGVIIGPFTPGFVADADIAAQLAEIDILSGPEVVAFCETNAIDFLIVGPEAPLAAGVADAARAAGILTFGPSAAAARLEASKAFTKEICDACNAPTAAYARFTAAEPARAYIRAQGAPIVVKADGLAAGKGVIVAMTEDEAIAAIDD